MSLHLDVSDVFLMIGLGVQFWGTKTMELKCHFHHMITGADTVNKTILMWTLITGLRQCFAEFLSWKVTFFFLFYTVALGGSHYVQIAIKVWGVVFALSP